MTDSSSSSTSGGVGFCGLLTVAFVVLKLTHVIAWSWWWVFAPLWAPAGVVLIVLAAMLAVAIVAELRK